MKKRQVNRRKEKTAVSILMGLVFLLSLIGGAPFASAEDDVPEPWMFYSFDDGTGADTGTAGNDATAVGTPKIVEKTEDEGGPAGKYLEIDSDENYFIAPGDAFDFGTSAFTVSFWVKFNSEYPLNLGERFFQTGLWGEGDTGFVIALNRDGGGNASVATAVAGTGPGDDFPGTWSFTSFSVDYFDGAWHLLTIVFDQPQKEYGIYLDGVSVGTKTYDRDNLSADTTRPEVGIGVFYHWGSLLMRPTYSLDDVAFYKSALTAEQISAYYDASGGKEQDFPNLEATLTDEHTGIEVTGKGLKDAVLYAAALTSGSAYDKLIETYGSFDDFILYNIAIEKDSEPMTFTDDVTVRIPIPDKLSSYSDLRVFQVADSGELVEIPCQMQDGTVQFMTIVMGDFAIAAQVDEEEDPEDIPNTHPEDIPNTHSDMSAMFLLTLIVLAASFALYIKKQGSC